MRIQTTALLGIALTLSSAATLAQPQPQPAAPPQPAPPAAPAAAQPPPDAAAAPPAPPPPVPAPPEEPPPPPAVAPSTPAPPPPPEPIFPSASESPVVEQQQLAGWHGNFFLRDGQDYFRLYPKGRIHLDFYSTFGPGVSDVTAADGGNALQPRFFIRRARFAVAGEFLKRWNFELEADFAGQALSNANGKSETAAGKAGEDPTAESARFASVQGTSSSIAPTDVWINYSVLPQLNFMFGQYSAPFSLENTTSDNSTSMMERNIAIRAFAFPSNRDIGLMLWGDTPSGTVHYGLGVFSGDGQNRPGVDANPDLIGRIYARPFASDKKAPLAKAQIGVSVQFGERDQEYVGYDIPSIRTGQGYTMWGSTYKDSLGRTVHIIPSGSQRVLGGELRVPFGPVDLRAEAYYLTNNTREAIEGYQLTNTERLGELKGLGWYVQASLWPLGDRFVSGDPGTSPKPTKLDLSKPLEKPKKGLELALLISGIRATYDGASRGGVYDANTPGGPDGVGSDISILQIGGSANYWYTKNIRATVSYSAYNAPDSGTPDNLAKVPGNTLKEPDPDAHIIHELGTRLMVAF